MAFAANRTTFFDTVHAAFWLVPSTTIDTHERFWLTPNNRVRMARVLPLNKSPNAEALATIEINPVNVDSWTTIQSYLRGRGLSEANYNLSSDVIRLSIICTPDEIVTLDDWVVQSIQAADAATSIPSLPVNGTTVRTDGRVILTNAAAQVMADNVPIDAAKSNWLVNYPMS